jgi:hypothetical protein
MEDEMEMQQSIAEQWPEYMSPTTAAHYLDVSINTLSDWRTKVRGPSFNAPYVHLHHLPEMRPLRFTMTNTDHGSISAWRMPA